VNFAKTDSLVVGGEQAESTALLLDNITSIATLMPSDLAVSRDEKWKNGLLLPTRVMNTDRFSFGSWIGA
jgi:hypothetical protein